LPHVKYLLSMTHAQSPLISVSPPDGSFAILDSATDSPRLRSSGTSMTSAELLARLSHALHLQRTAGFSTPAALAAAWGRPYEPVPVPPRGAMLSLRRSRHTRNRRTRMPIHRSTRVVQLARRRYRRDQALAQAMP
jgi:hypothetical protein